MTASGDVGVVDVHYPDAGGARTGFVVASDLRAAPPWSEQVTWSEAVAPYEPGQFWRRELPPLLAAVQSWHAAGRPTPTLLVIDGFVTLDPHGRPGLGMRVHEALGVPVIGVAKTAFATAAHAVPVTRGEATRPVHVTAVGVDPREAAAVVAAMEGPYRLPDAVRRADKLARGALPASGPPTSPG